MGPNNFISTLANPSILNTSSSNTGTYTLSVTDQNNCSAVQSVEIDIQEGISNPIIQKEGGNCIGESINLTATRYENPTVQYEWDFPAAIGISSIKSPTLAIPSANENYIGDYIVTASVNNCIVQSDTFSLSLSNRPVFQPTANYVETEDCEASDLSLFANATGTDLIYNWKGPNGFSCLLYTSDAADE